jgi:hypothetical protein
MTVIDFPEQSARQFPKLRPLTIEELKNQPERKSVVKGIFGVGEFSVVYGEPKCGKSFWAFDLALAVARGVAKWFGKKVKQGPVIYIAAEGIGGVAKRIEASFQHHELNDTAIPFYPILSSVDLLDENGDIGGVIYWVKQVEELTGQKVSMVVIDTLSRTMPGGDENAARDMTQYINNCDSIRHETGAHVVVIHHKPKGNSNTPRGHSSLFGAVDTLILVEKHSSGNTWKVEASKDDEDGYSAGFKLEVVDLGTDKDGDEITSCVVVAADVVADNKAKRLTGGNAIAMEALHDVMCRDDVKIINNRAGIPNNTKCGSVEAWRKEFYSRAADKPSQDAKRQAFGRAMTALKDRNYIAFRHDHVWILTLKKEIEDE